MAAHLHDSVLQTLALIQKNSGDPTDGRPARPRPGARPARLAVRRGVRPTTRTVASALRGVAAEVEDAHGVAVEWSPSGTATIGERAAARWSRRPARRSTNAAKHAGDRRVDVYAEITDDAVDVFVRDRGRGFDPAGIPEDRYGVRHSIIDRMQRHGGTARDPVRPRRGHRGAAAPAPAADRKATTNDDRGVANVGVVVVDDHAMFRRGRPRRARGGGVGRGRRARRGRRRRRGGGGGAPSTSRTSYSSTCTCRAAAASR